MWLSSVDNLEIGSVSGMKSEHLFFRGFFSIDDDTVMDDTLIIEHCEGTFRIDRLIPEECTAIRQMRNGDLWCLGFFGNLYIRRGASWFDLHIEPGRKNSMVGIWEIDSAVWASDSGGTILKFENNTWVNAVSDSRSGGHIYSLLPRGRELLAVGDDGLLLRIKEHKASRIELPTNQALKGITMLADQRLVICGDRGTLLIGQEDRWTDHSRPDMDVDFHRVVSWRNRTFISAETQILEFRDGELEPAAEVTSFELIEAGEWLWSIGVKELNYLANDSWQPFVVEIEIEDEGPLEARPMG
jgi:hypothetical protein